MTKKNFKKWKPLLPSYSYLPLLLVILTNFFAFNVTRLISTGLPHYDLSLAVDGKIPFIPAFVLAYVIAFVQWVLSYILIARESKELCFRLIAGELISKLFSALIFVLLPTTMARPEVSGTDFWSWGVRLIYAIDPADNLFPSLHVLESWLCFRAALQLKKPGRWYRWISLVVSLSVFASVVLIKQHLFVDILGGIAIMEIGQWIAGKTNAGNIFEKLNIRFFKAHPRVGEFE